MKRTVALLATLTALAQQACATALEPDASQDEASAGTTSSGGTAGHAGTSGTSSGTSTSGGSARGGSAGSAGSGTAGRSNSAGNSSLGGSPNAGSSGTSANGGAANGGSESGGSSIGGSGSGGMGQGGGAACDATAATALTAMNSNTPVKSDACLALQIPADQTWIKKVTLQPEGATYPLPFTWSNCATNGSGAFTANYANVVLDSVTAQCPVLLKLGGTGTSFNVQWWGG